MRVFLILFRKELKGFLLHPLGWIIMALVIGMHGMSLSTAIKLFKDSPRTSSLIYVSFLNTPIFWFYFMFIFPLITMRLFSDEQRHGTLETLLTAPVKTGQVVLSKYFAALVFYCLLWVPSFFQFYMFSWVTNLPPAWNSGSMIGAYSILFLIGAFFISLGCLASSLTSSSVIAGIMTIGFLVLHYFLGFVTKIWGESFLGAGFFDHMSSQQHLSAFCNGLIDSKVVIYYVSMSSFIVYVTYHVLDFRRWRR
jgi:ABC-2 type transport system permease protein